MEKEKDIAEEEIEVVEVNTTQEFDNIMLGFINPMFK